MPGPPPESASGEVGKKNQGPRPQSHAAILLGEAADLRVENKDTETGFGFWFCHLVAVWPLK